MNPAEAAWAIALVLLAGLALLSFRHRSVGIPELREEHLVRSPEHQAKVITLTDWLQQPKIVRTMLETKVATAEGIQRTFEQLEAMEEGEVNATVGLLLSDRTVRRVVVAHMERNRGLPPAEVRRALLEWADPIKQEFLQ